ncbi:hypothetical protein RHMOL_Rhmol11G0001000 [Rhododendron molle]|uniref:Uncharacterized protein n=1 Tax=Rhododendron molle TaxID=49168 RepID=A0ACC0LNF6_RHOML|nr:hypothetical protein RHMOL_Rhmol11G0001000 [Rhododendron molle]
MADHGDGGGGEEVVDRPEDRGGPMESQFGDQMATEEVTGGSGTVAKGSSVVGGSSGGVGGSGAAGDDPAPNGTPLRNLARGKGIAVSEEPVEEEQTTKAAPFEFREEDIAFRPPVTAATSSHHVPITKDDITAHLPDDMLARLLDERPDIREIVLKAKEERTRAVATWEAAEKTERERKDREEPLREMEAEEKAAEEAQGPRVTAVAEAAAMRRPDYGAETYTPLTPHLLIPSGFSAYKP